MSEGGLPGAGLKLGPELLRGTGGVWYSATGADGRTLAVLRFHAAPLEAAGGVDRLVERTVAARAGMLPGTLPVVDLVADAGRIWLVTSVVPEREAAERTEALLLGSTPVSAYGAASYAQGAQDYAMGPAWRPSVEVGGSTPQWTNRELRDSWPSRVFRTVVGLVLVAGVLGAAAFVGLKVRDKKPTTPVQISSISVHNYAPVRPAGICNASVDMVAELTTNGGTGVVHYEWDIPAKNRTTQTVAGSETVSGSSPKVHLAWRLKLTGSGTVTATFRITNPGVLAAGAETASSGDLKYQCP